MDQRRGNRASNNPLGFGDVLKNPVFQFRRDGQTDALLRGAIIDDAFVTGVTVVAQNQSLQSKLHPVRVPQLVGFLAFFRRARLVVKDRKSVVEGKSVLL